MSLDFADDHGDPVPAHYAFLVTEAEFDQICGRINADVGAEDPEAAITLSAPVPLPPMAGRRIEATRIGTSFPLAISAQRTDPTPAPSRRRRR